MAEIDDWDVPVFTSLNRPDHLAGMERYPFLLLTLFGLAVCLTFNVYAIIAAGFFYIAMLGVLRRVTKLDPNFCVVLFSYLQQQNFYPARRWRK